MNPEQWGTSLKKCMYLLCHNELKVKMSASAMHVLANS